MTTIYELLEDLRNENEQLVTDLVHRYQIEDRLSCDCRECLLNITVLTLNAVEPRSCVSSLTEFHVDEEDTIRFNNDVKKPSRNPVKLLSCVHTIYRMFLPACLQQFKQLTTKHSRLKRA